MERFTVYSFGLLLFSYQRAKEITVKIRWWIFWFFFIALIMLEGDVFFNSWYESHYHGYDGGYFLFFVALAAVGIPIFAVWAILNHFIDPKKDVDK